MRHAASLLWCLRGHVYPRGTRSNAGINSVFFPMCTCSEGGFFKAHLIFPKDYPQMPPKMKFISDIWHPNGMSSHLACGILEARGGSGEGFGGRAGGA